MRRVTLFLPGLLQRPDAESPSFDIGRYAALETVLAKGRQTPWVLSAAESHEAMLCTLFGLTTLGAQAELPIAALTRLSDRGDYSQDAWVRADPVHLRPDLGKLRLLGVQSLQLDEATAQELCTELNAHLSEDQLQLSIGKDPQRWYLQLPTPSPEIHSTPPGVALGHHIDPYLPQGSAAPAWNRLSNELQMLLHSSPVNARIESAGGLPVNSLWFWGFGALPKLASPPWQVILANDPLAVGLGMASGTKTALLPQRMENDALDKAADVFVLPVDLQPAFLHQGLAAWVKHLEELEARWFEPLLQLLGSGRLQECVLVTDTARFQLRRSDLWRIWRSPRPLLAYCQASPLPR